jgi:large subunit ribosomal protein L21
MYAVFEVAGKQFRAEPGTRLRVPTLQAEPGAKVTFEKVFLAGEEGAQIHVGTPTLSGATVTAEILRHGRAPKVMLFKRKRRDGYRRKKGHRQGFTEIRVHEVALA